MTTKHTTAPWILHKLSVEMERIDGDAERYAEMVANLNE